MCRALPKNYAGSQDHHPAAKNGSRQVSNSVTNPPPPDTPKGLWPFQCPAGFPTPPSLSIKDSLEPYVSVGCLKCGASDHVATNRNCPRPRKAAPIARTTPVQALIPKKNTTRSPKKSAIDNYHLKAAKSGDDTKFWFYISDDSDDEKQGSSKSEMRTHVGKNVVTQDQGSTVSNGNYSGHADDGPMVLPNPTDGLIQLGLDPTRFTSKDTRKIKKVGITKITQDNVRPVQPITYDPSVESTRTINPSTLRRQHEIRIQAGQKPNSLKAPDGGGLGSIPSLPWKTSATSPLSPMKHSISSPMDVTKATKTPKQRKAISKSASVEVGRGHEELDTPPQKQSRKGNQVLHTVSTKTTISSKSQQNIDSIIDVTHEMIHPSHSFHQPLTTQSALAQSSHYPTAIPRHPHMNTNYSSDQRIEDSFSVEKTEIKKFRYNYMGARNTVQAPRVRYAADRVQGWRECRSMGTGLE